MRCDTYDDVKFGEDVDEATIGQGVDYGEDGDAFILEEGQCVNQLGGGQHQCQVLVRTHSSLLQRRLQQRAE